MNLHEYFKMIRMPEGAIQTNTRICLNSYLANEHSYEDNFMITVEGDSMKGAGILEGDTLLVDTSKVPRDGDIVVAELNSSLLVKRLKYLNDKIVLFSENPIYYPINVGPEDEIFIKGIVRNVIREY